MATPRSSRMGAAAAATASVVLALCLGPELARAQPRGQPQQEGPPSWLADEGKDLFTDLQADEKVYGTAACETREKLLKHMKGKGEPDAASHRQRVLLGLGLCEFIQGNFEKSKLLLDSCISELNLPNEQVLMQNAQIAPLGLMKQAAEFMVKHELTQAGTALRRCREVMNRNLKSVLKMVHKQISQQQGAKNVPPVDMLIEETSGFGKTGQFLPMLMKQVPLLKQDLPMSEVVDQELDKLDGRIVAFDASQKAKRLKLDVSKGKGKSGSLLYARGLALLEPFVPRGRAAVAEELVSGGVTEALLEEAQAAEKAATLVKRTKEGKDCKGFPKTCAALLKVADVHSNGFGETRLLAVKAKKPQPLGGCTTNANIGILVAVRDGARVSVAGATEPTELKAGEPVVIDFCREPASVEADAPAAVLFAQAWHPEFAAVERTTELRARSKSFGLSEDDLKAATKVVNDHAKKSWEKTAKQWRQDSEALAELRKSLQNEASAKAKKEEEAAEAKRREDESSDEERQRKLEELEKKREAKRKAAQEAEEKRLRRKKQLEEEKRNKDPWLLKPEVLAAEKKVEELKEARRDANAKLEFDLSTQLTKDIAAAERELKKATKAAKKAHKKGGGAAQAPAGEAKEEKEPAGGGGELAELKRRLEDAKEKKLAASKVEDYATAKKMRAEQKDLEEQIKKLEL